MGRPKAEINLTPEQVEELAEWGATDSEIAALCDVSPQTIARRFGKNLTKGRSAIKRKLRRKQIDVALKGNVAMLIWLGKQYLEQSDKTEVADKNGGPFIFNHAAAVAAIASGSIANRGASGDGESDHDGAQVG